MKIEPGSTVWYVIKFVLVVCQSRGLLQYIKTKVLTTCCYLKALLKAKGDLELVSLPHFLHDFWGKIFLTLYITNWSNFTAWLPLLLEISDNMCIKIIFSTVRGVIHFGINHRILNKSFFYITKKSGKICRYLENKKSFYHEINNIFHRL